MDSIDIIVVPRDRFSVFRRCLEAIYVSTPAPFRVIVVAGGTDKATEEYLLGLAARRSDLTAILTERLLMQAEARNLGLQRATARRCVVLENDTIVGHNWLTPLRECMEQEGAAVIAPLIMWYRGIHAAGCLFEQSQSNGVVFRHTIIYADAGRRQIHYPENHCILIDRRLLPQSDLFDDVEPFDVDLGLLLRKQGLKAFVEPRSQVTYEAPPPWEVRDIPPYKFRWDPASWGERNQQFAQKWGIIYEPSAKLASYRRQQLKLGLARWRPNRMTVGLSNLAVGVSQRLLSSIMQGGSWGHAPQLRQDRDGSGRVP